MIRGMPCYPVHADTRVIHRVMRDGWQIMHWPGRIPTGKARVGHLYRLAVRRMIDAGCLSGTRITGVIRF